eukprot:COSAG02_NODE_28_length_51367_cov_70.053932_34_plen_159_part_00
MRQLVQYMFSLLPRMQNYKLITRVHNPRTWAMHMRACARRNSGRGHRRVRQSGHDYRELVVGGTAKTGLMQQRRRGMHADILVHGDVAYAGRSQLQGRKALDPAGGHGALCCCGGGQRASELLPTLAYSRWSADCCKRREWQAATRMSTAAMRQAGIG